MLGLRRRTTRKSSSGDESLVGMNSATTNTTRTTSSIATANSTPINTTATATATASNNAINHATAGDNDDNNGRKSSKQSPRKKRQHHLLSGPNKLLASFTPPSLVKGNSSSIAATATTAVATTKTTTTSTCNTLTYNAAVPRNVTVFNPDAGRGTIENHQMLHWKLNSHNNNNNNNDDNTQNAWASSIRKNDAQFAMSQAAAEAAAAVVKRDESKMHKIFIRLFFGILMVMIFLSHLYMGHVYLCGLIFFTEVMLFRELVKVRYNTFFYIIEETIPLFRTTQWLWFWTAIFYTYSDFAVEVIKGNTSLHYLLDYARFQTGFSFLLYSGTFVLTIATIQPGYIRFQLNQLCWTILVLCLTVGQLKYIMHNVYNGLFWFTLPIMLVVSNDSFAWLAGITCGRKFIQREFISISPNKTWEGFIGGWIGTMIFGWHLARFMAKYTWMICPETTFSLLPGPLECEPNHVFQPATNIFPSQIFELIPSGIAQMIPGVVDICMIDGNPLNLTACVSGEDRHTHHHFELVLKDLYPVQIHALGLSLFASFVAPFGGFLASAIKRAYGLKDFASFIPGHGGMMDRMDCQLLMALCTWVHYNTFVNMTTVSVPKMIYMYKLMKETEQEEFLKKIAEL
jgi:phosphatidate cytidylyltransferase